MPSSLQICCTCCRHNQQGQGHRQLIGPLAAGRAWLFVMTDCGGSDCCAPTTTADSLPKVSSTPSVLPTLRTTQEIPLFTTSCAQTVTITRCSCQKRQGVCANKLQVKAVNILHLLKLARSKQQPINRGHDTQFKHRAPPAGAQEVLPFISGATRSVACLPGSSGWSRYKSGIQSHRPSRIYMRQDMLEVSPAQSWRS